MRTIPPSLLEKINKRHQTIYENADPKLKVLLSKGFSKELFRVYTIHELDNIAEIDATAKRSTAESEPDKLYVVYIENGVAHVKSKDLPYDELTPWDYEFELGSASNVAIDFDGYWERDEESKRFNLIADEYPWVFRVYSGSLTAQYWQDSPVVLSTNVSKIRSVKGWVPANGDETNDQGLIIFYLKTDGNVYYRNYTIQASGSKLWEVERQITEFTGTVVDIALFRTNDFRVGFIVQNDDGTIEYVVTDRNWAGMSFFPENIEAGITDITVEVHEIEYTDSFEEENITAEIGVPRLYICPYDTVAEITSWERLELENEKTIKLTFNHLLECDLEKLKETLLISNESGYYFEIESFSYESTVYFSEGAGIGDILVITTVEDMPFAQDVFIEYNEEGSYYLALRIDSNCLWDYGAFTLEVPGMPPEGYCEENLTAGIGDIDISVLEVTYTDSYGEETVTVGLDDISIVVTKVGDNPL